MIYMNLIKYLIYTIDRYSHLIPIFLLFIFGILTNQHIIYYVISLILSLVPALLGIPNPIGEVIYFFQKIYHNNKKQEKINQFIVSQGLTFLRKINAIGVSELKLMAECILRNNPGFNRELNDRVVKKLIQLKFIYKENKFNPSGYPFYFYEKQWILMKHFKEDIFKIHDSISSIKITPKKIARRQFNILTFILNWFFALIRLIAILLIGSVFGPVAWFIWIILIGTVISTIVWSGDFLLRFFGI